MNIVTIIATILVLIGGIAWGLVGLADFNIVSLLFDPIGLTRIVYILVGLSAIWLIGADIYTRSSKQ